ncbi:hypothetical protein B5P43_09895 [Bacillus sp. SRB_336]|nr:hypothetical protein B5P43_09895 [Bacillus sp. SRB_336]
MTCSVSRSGNCWENLAISLKAERTDGKVYRTRADAKADVFDYIERFYNSRRRRSTLGYVNPIQFKQQMQLAQDGVHGTSSSPHPTPFFVDPVLLPDICLWRHRGSHGNAAVEDDLTGRDLQRGTRGETATHGGGALPLVQP